jgi:2-hydroxychromene-2-carboxylate isomerase
LWFHGNEDRGIVFAPVVPYLDDLLVIANEGLIGPIKNQINNMKNRFRMHDLGRVSCSLGMNIKRYREHHPIVIH